MGGGYHLFRFRLSVLHCFDIAFLAVDHACFVLTSIRSSMIAGVVMGIDGGLKRAVFPLPQQIHYSDLCFSISVPSRGQSVLHSYGSCSHGAVSSLCSFVGSSNCLDASR